MEKQVKARPSAAETRNTIVESVLSERLRPLVRVTDSGCWELQNKGADSTIRRIVYRMFRGDFDSRLELLHSCDNPPCVNPDHLRPGTHKENMADMMAKGRSRGGAPRGVVKKQRPKKVASILGARCKLSDKQLRELRAIYEPGDNLKEFSSAMAFKFGIGAPTVKRYLKRLLTLQG